MFFLVLWALGVVTAVVDLFLKGFPGGASEICTTLLLHQFVVTFGLLGIIGFVTNVIKADEMAEKLGWPGGPYQVKYGFSQAGIGITGILCIWLKGGYWAGALMAMYIYGVSGLWSHWAEMKRRKEKTGKTDIDSIANIIMDIVYQGFITVLSIAAGGIWITG